MITIQATAVSAMNIMDLLEMMQQVIQLENAKNVEMKIAWTVAATILVVQCTKKDNDLSKDRFGEIFLYFLLIQS